MKKHYSTTLDMFSPVSNSGFTRVILILLLITIITLTEGPGSKLLDYVIGIEAGWSAIVFSGNGIITRNLEVIPSVYIISITSYVPIYILICIYI